MDGFHYIVIDPPWENKSAERKNSYPTFYMKRLFQLPVTNFLAAEFSIVAVWVTNNPKIINFVKTELFQFWKVKYSTTWYWVKCTNQGELVFPLHTSHRKPYECLIIGVYNPNSISMDNITSLTENRIILSTPILKQHSRKPYLAPFFDPIITELTKTNTENIRRLELFARNLTLGWFSWGNEVLANQNICYFNIQEEDVIKIKV